MKKLLFVLLLMLSSLIVTAQTDSLNYQLQIDNIQSNLSHYHSERMITDVLYGVSSALIVGSYYVPTTDSQTLMLCFSAVIGITSTVILIDSEKWIKRASIRITPGKLTINF